ncbi:hypothetical protein P389DRAFT_81677 [Cystobasidium minutum MCA 4210]|uniref:uncharacterized protein n=1 Tax=Cystobasidium minutum MCA 4210 TaxID=1397322 RepID=UPI0034CE2428|eukprot:jgi/Rhomi1/81677/CE81676_524
MGLPMEERLGKYEKYAASRRDAPLAPVKNQQFHFKVAPVTEPSQHAASTGGGSSSKGTGAFRETTIHELLWMIKTALERYDEAEQVCIAKVKRKKSMSETATDMNELAKARSKFRAGCAVLFQRLLDKHPFLVKWIDENDPSSDLSIQFGRGAPQVANTEDGGAKHDTEDLLEALQRIKSLEGTVLEMEADTLTLQAFENDLQVQLHEATEHCSA